MKLHHIAYRVKDRYQAVAFFIETFGYRVQDEFEVDFDDGSKAKCVALEHDELHQVFVSDGDKDSIVGKWVHSHRPRIHHIAYLVDSVLETMVEWQAMGYEFTTEEPLTCPGIVQIFTKPNEHTDMIYEFIETTNKGFCKDNVKNLMQSTKGI